MKVNRNFVVKKVEELSGKAATFYTIKFFDRRLSELEDFIASCGESHPEEVADILTTIKEMGQKYGAREQFFKEWEGRPGDGVCALYDMEGSHLRMYCIRYGKIAVILGSGGHKPKTIRSLQENERLTATNALVRAISRLIDARIRNKEIWWDEIELKGNLNFNFEEDED